MKAVKPFRVFIQFIYLNLNGRFDGVKQKRHDEQRLEKYAKAHLILLHRITQERIGLPYRAPDMQTYRMVLKGTSLLKHRQEVNLKLEMINHFRILWTTNNNKAPKKKLKPHFLWSFTQNLYRNSLCQKKKKLNICHRSQIKIKHSIIFLPGSLLNYMSFRWLPPHQDKQVTGSYPFHQPKLANTPHIGLNLIDSNKLHQIDFYVQ